MLPTGSLRLVKFNVPHNRNKNYSIRQEQTGCEDTVQTAQRAELYRDCNIQVEHVQVEEYILFSTMLNTLQVEDRRRAGLSAPLSLLQTHLETITPTSNALLHLEDSNFASATARTV